LKFGLERGCLPSKVCVSNIPTRKEVILMQPIDSNAANTLLRRLCKLSRKVRCGCDTGFGGTWAACWTKPF